MNRYDRRRKPGPDMVWSRKWKMWLDVDHRSSAERRADEAIARGVEEEAFGLLRKLVAARKAAGLTQAMVARRMKAPQPVVARLEAEIHSPTLDTLTRYAAAIGVTFDLVRLKVTSPRRTRTTRPSSRASPRPCPPP
ncbi:MAG TPA: helix-turn-helix transcriptional regulator [Planctomycetota bacterium]|nr:helix-turn-helix transcriptional regulator [Planctomycetota bacterium]